MTVTGANATTAGVDSGAVYAISDSGNASVTTTGTVATTGASSLGIYAGSNTGNATVVANNVSTAGNNGAADHREGRQCLGDRQRRRLDTGHAGLFERACLRRVGDRHRRHRDRRQ